MAYTISNLKSELNGMLHGTTTNKVTGINQVIERAARKLLTDVDPAETKRKGLLNTTVTGDVFSYQIPEDLKGDKIIDLYNFNNSRSDAYNQRYSQDFNMSTASALTASNGLYFANGALTQAVSIQWENGTRVLKINNQKTIQSTTINDLSSLTTNGTFIALGTPTNVYENSINYVGSTGASLQVTIPLAATTGGIQTTNATAVDISEAISTYRAYFWVYISNGYTVSNIAVNYGLDLGNYYSVNITKNNEGNSFQNGWNLCSFYLKDAAVTGTPGTTTGQYISILVTQDGTKENLVLFNQFNAKLGENLMMEYYSKYLFRDATTGEFKEKLTGTDTEINNTIINLDTDSYNLLLYLSCVFCFQQINDQISMTDNEWALKQYAEALQMYKNNYKSEIIKPRQNYYTVNRSRGFYRN